MGFFVTGDVHGAIYERFNEFNFPPSFLSSGKNYVIVCGDFGGIWSGNERDEYWLKWLSKRPFDLLFVDGNHENFNLLNSYPIQTWNGGKVHKIRHNVFHLMRGQVFSIQGKKIFTFGGAVSVDKALRQEDVSWWKEEMPSDAEYDEAIYNLEINDYTVDYIFTHTCSATILNTIPEYRLYSGVAEADPLNDFFDSLEEKVAFKHWFFGHFHYAERLDEKHTVIYQNIKKIYDKWSIL